MNLNLENLLSILPFFIHIFYFLKIVYYYNLNKNELIKKYIKLLSLLLFSALTAQTLKYIFPYPKSLYKYTMRPEGACDCNYLSNDGLRLPNTPGFPSGHMTSTSFFVANNIFNGYPILPNLIYLGLMGWARIVKKCHNIPQVIAGTLLGTGIHYYFYKI